MASYLKDHERSESSLPAINGGGVRAGRCELRGSQVVQCNDSGHCHGHHNHRNSLSGDEGTRHVRFVPSHHGSTSSLNREFTTTISKEYSTTRAQSPSCQNRKHVLDMEDKLRLYKAELSKKDELINKLTELDTPRNRHVDINMSQIEESFSSERAQAMAEARSEAAALVVKVDGLTAQLREVKSQLEARDNMLRELRKEVEIVRENEAKHVAIAQSLRERLVQYEAQHGSFEGAKERTDIVIASLKREKDESNSNILELESRLRNLVQDKEQAVTSMVNFETKYREITRHLSSVFGVSDSTFDSSTTDLVSRLTSLMEENTSLNERLSTVNEYIRTAEIETKASRETIMRLVKENEEKLERTSQHSLEMEHVKQDYERAVTKREELEQELRLMHKRLEASQNAWAGTRRQLEEKETTYSKYSRECQDLELMVRNLESGHRAFKESLVALLSDGCIRIEPYDCQIRERIEVLVCNARDKSSHVDLLNSKIRALTEELDKQIEMAKSADRRTKRVEADYFEIEARLRHMEAELASEGIIRDNLRHDKEMYMQFLERCCRIMKLDMIASDVGMEMAIDAIFARCEQIAKMEVDAISDKQNAIYGLQRKLKAHKEQLESRDLHIDLLRKKVVAMEERLAGKSELEREKDSEAIKSKKLMKLIEKYKRELQESHNEIRDMKAQLLEGSQLRNRTLEAEGHIGCLETKVDQLQNVRQKQAEKISMLRTDAEMKADHLASGLDAANTTVQALTRELKTTKSGLDESSKREKQLLDLRQVFARMLGLDVNALAVPDYEIIARLEKLILAHQSSAAASVAIDTAITDMEDGFRQGYTQAGKVFVRARSPMRARSPTRPRTATRTRTRNRARSVSPQRRKDNRSY